MPLHVHLLINAEGKDSIYQVMKVVASCYAYYMNRSFRRI
ncbi:hypothetical protein [Oceanicoccus sp. KOV_DT_Chl]